MKASSDDRTFYGWRVAGAVFVLAMFGWGIGFYGPPIYLHAVRDARGWSTGLVSTAVTVHFLFGAVVVANLPGLYRRFGVATVTKAGSVAASLGVLGWALATTPWHLFAATLLSGAGWVTMGAAAVNALVAPWFVRTRPQALAFAYNGSSVGGAVFSPLWVALIAQIGFPAAAAVIGLATIVSMWLLSDLYFSKTPGQMGLRADGDAVEAAPAPVSSSVVNELPDNTVWRTLRFQTLAAGMALGLFAQIGLLAHLFSLLVPTLGAHLSGIAASAATVAAVAGRTIFGWLMPRYADRRLLACASYLAQIAGSFALLLAAGSSIPLLLAGILLFGFGIGNATSLPPLIAQKEFTSGDVARVVPMIVAIGQGTYAFAPAVFGLVRELSPTAGPATPQLFITAALIQTAAVIAFLIGRRPIATAPQA